MAAAVLPSDSINAFHLRYQQIERLFTTGLTTTAPRRAQGTAP